MRKNIIFDMEGTLVDGHSAIEGMRELLTELRAKGHRLLVVTSALTALAKLKLRSLEFELFFEAIYGCDWDGRDNSKGEVIAHALRRHELVPQETALIGDSDSDISGARAHNLTSIGVLWGFGSIDDFARAGAEFVVERPDQVAPLLETLQTIEKKKVAGF